MKVGTIKMTHYEINPNKVTKILESSNGNNEDNLLKNTLPEDNQKKENKKRKVLNSYEEKYGVYTGVGRNIDLKA